MGMIEFPCFSEHGGNFDILKTQVVKALFFFGQFEFIRQLCERLFRILLYSTSHARENQHHLGEVKVVKNVLKMPAVYCCYASQPPTNGISRTSTCKVVCKQDWRERETGLQDGTPITKTLKRCNDQRHYTKTSLKTIAPKSTRSLQPQLTFIVNYNLEPSCKLSLVHAILKRAKQYNLLQFVDTSCLQAN